ncbi:unnamed protein product, partial [Prorocentrum cordatum]
RTCGTAEACRTPKRGWPSPCGGTRRTSSVGGWPTLCEAPIRRGSAGRLASAGGHRRRALARPPLARTLAASGAALRGRRPRASPAPLAQRWCRPRVLRCPAAKRMWQGPARRPLRCRRRAPRPPATARRA